MDSMDWFPPTTPTTTGKNTKNNSNPNPATAQVRKLNRALRMGGRVLLRSAARKPWYLREFEAHGFATRCVGDRSSGQAGNGGDGGKCIDRVNMYASCWVCEKVANLPPPTPGLGAAEEHAGLSLEGGDDGADLLRL